MKHTPLTSETVVTLLLCGRFESSHDGEREPLTPREFNDALRVLRRLSIPLGDLPGDEGQRRFRSDLEGAALFDGRVGSLLERRAEMESALSRWQRDGVQVIDRTHPDYPERYRNLLAERAPPLLYIAGESAGLNTDEPRIAAVGSRDIDREAGGFATRLGRSAAGYGARLISGGARGVDRIAVDGVLDAGGRATVLLPGNLARMMSLWRFQQPVAEGRLVLMTPYAPEEPFRGEYALGRNRLIYCLADLAVVVETSLRTGGTWAGANEALRLGRVPVYVRQTDPPSPGNRELIDLGARPLRHEVVDDPRRFAAWLESRLRETRTARKPGGDTRQLELFKED